MIHFGIMMEAYLTAQPVQRRSSKRALAVRIMAAEVAWLAGTVRWNGGKIAWESYGRLIVPDAGDLALAQRRLYKIRRYPIAADLALGDGQAWLERHSDRLVLAKRLRALQTPDLPELARQARAGSDHAVERLAEHLLIEALCVDELPISPAAVLAECGPLASRPLRALIEDETAPPAARALAALTLGAVSREHSALGNGLTNLDADGSRSAVPDSLRAWLGRAYAYGHRSGLPRTPALAVLLLQDRDGAALVRRCELTLAGAVHLPLAPVLLRELLAEGNPPAQIVALAEAAAATEPLAERILRRRQDLNGIATTQRRTTSAELLRLRRQFLASLAELLSAWARTTADPECIHLCARFVGQMLDLAPITEPLADATIRALRFALERSATLRRPALELLNELHAAVWDRATMPGAKRNRPASMAGWLDARWRQHAAPMLELLRQSRDAEIAREAVQLGVHRQLAAHPWRDPGQIRLALTLTRTNRLATERHTLGQVLVCLDVLGDASAANAALLPINQALTSLDPALREHFLSATLGVLPRMRAALITLAPQIARFLPRLIRYDKDDRSESCLCSPLLETAAALYTGLPAQADAWLDWLLEHISPRGREQAHSDAETASLEVGLQLAVALAGDDFARFQLILSAAQRHIFDGDCWKLAPGLKLLSRFPALRATLARLFPQQPHRCVSLLVRLGAATHLPPQVLAPLDELKQEPPAASAAYRPTSFIQLSPDWRRLLDLAPDLAPAVAAFQYAQWLLGGSQEMPGGVRRALEQPRRLKDELAFLERALTEQPGRQNLARRAANLRERLADEERLARDALVEARERLAQTSAEAQLAAAEQQVLACYHARLAAVAGPLPEGLHLDADLLNATLLTTDIQHNRRLLLRLLRAHLAGDRTWRERHPMNIAFLEKLAGQGVDATTWLGEHPRVYPCPGFAGGRLRLHLEHDPLRVLQMGNYVQTCLSLGGGNAFSTVANACELNKRVIYARDGAGQVVGRKLIAISAEGKLVGFDTYTTVGSEQSRTVREVVARYARDFARRCRLELADNGEVPRLFTEAWYDDGCVGWDDDAEPAGSTADDRHTTARRS